MAAPVGAHRGGLKPGIELRSSSPDRRSPELRHVRQRMSGGQSCVAGVCTGSPCDAARISSVTEEPGGAGPTIEQRAVFTKSPVTVAVVEAGVGPGVAIVADETGLVDAARSFRRRAVAAGAVRVEATAAQQAFVEAAVAPAPIWRAAADAWAAIEGAIAVLPAFILKIDGARDARGPMPGRNLGEALPTTPSTSAGAARCRAAVRRADNLQTA